MYRISVSEYSIGPFELLQLLTALLTFVIVSLACKFSYAYLNPYLQTDFKLGLDYFILLLGIGQIGYHYYIMSWRSVASRSCNKMLGSWSFPGREGIELWRLQSSCNQTREAIQRAYTHLTNIQVNQVQAKINGQTTTDLNLVLKDGMFDSYPDILKKLNSSKFICYRFGSRQHFVTYIYDGALQKWVPLQAFQEVINLADWMNTFDDDGSMETALNALTTKISPITHPRTYWTYFWSHFIEKFQRTQLMRDQNQQLKQAKLQQFLTVLQRHEIDDRVIMWAFCDGKP